MQIGSISEVISALVTVLALCGVFIEYKEKQKQWRLQLAQEVERQLENNETLSFCITCLDWGAGRVPVPCHWREIVGEPAIVPDVQLMYQALRPELTHEIAQNPKGLLYRHAFVVLFNYLGRVEDLMRRGALLSEDLSELPWVAGQLKAWKYAADPQRKHFFMAAIDDWYPDHKPSALINRLSA
jgi:hypothetical protein